MSHLMHGVEAWLRKHRTMLEAQEWQGESFLPGLDGGVYFVGQRHPRCLYEESGGLVDCSGDPTAAFETCYPLVKIGYAKNIASRFTQLKSHNAQQIACLAVFGGKFAHEKQLHRLFATTRFEREWFWHSPELHHLIETIVDYGGFSSRLGEAA